jgi:ABC-type transport system involved in multi-copper enzyme maturation permease subunit
MIRMLSAELLKLRRRWASYIVLLVLIVMMGLVFLLVGFASQNSSSAALVVTFPGAYDLINQFVFGLGSLLAVAYAAAIGGADWNWGVIRVVIARGESRGGYILVKALGIAIVLLIGVVIAYVAGILFTFGAAALAHIQAGNPFGSGSLERLVRMIADGYLVLLERAAIGFGVAVLLRSQLAGVVVGIVLYIGESILAGVLLAITISTRFGGPGINNRPGIDNLGTQWFQFLPFNIGNSVLNSGTTSPNDIASALLQPVEVNLAIIVVVIYLAAALALAVITTERAEISS